MNDTPPPTLPAAVPASVTPFWQRMPQLFLLPLQRPALVAILAATAVFTAGAWIALAAVPGAPVRALLTLLLAWAGTSLYVARFGFLVIERSAAGYLDTRRYPRGEAGPDWLRPLKMFFIAAVVPVLIILLGLVLLPHGLVFAALLLFALLLPASVMVLTRTDSMADALNPKLCLQTALRIGPPYLLLCLFLLMLWVSSREAIAFLHGASVPAPAVPADGSAAGPAAAPAGRMALGASLFVFTLVGNYFMVLTCALIGYVMYQYSAALGIEVVGPGEVDRGAPASSAAHQRRVREAMIGKLIAAGDFRDAIGLLNEDLHLRPNDLSLRVRLHTLLLQEGALPRIHDHAERYLELMLAASNFPGALALFEQTRQMFPDFAPRDAARLVQLARAALEAQKPALAAELIRGFDRRFPGHPAIPEAYLVGGRILLQTHQSEEARRLFGYVAGSFDGSPAAAEARRYLARFTINPDPGKGPAAPVARPAAQPPAPAGADPG